MTGEPVVRMEHVRACNFCSRGARAWFARYGLDWQAFLQSGLPASAFESTGDHLGLQVAQAARQAATGAAA